MVTKLKSRDNLKYLILVILICICSTVLLSRYGSFYEAGEKAQKEKADSMENVISDMGDGLAIGNFWTMKYPEGESSRSCWKNMECLSLIC